MVSALAGAIGGNYARHVFIGEDVMVQTIGQQLSAGLLLLPLALLNPPSCWPSLPEAGALLALALLSTALAFLIYFRLIREIGVTRTLTVEFPVPVFAAIWGLVLIGETLSVAVIVGGLMILLGCGLVNGWRLPPFYRTSRRAFAGSADAVADDMLQCAQANVCVFQSIQRSTLPSRYSSISSNIRVWERPDPSWPLTSGPTMINPLIRL